jgi:hypothetical protein
MNAFFSKKAAETVGYAIYDDQHNNGSRLRATAVFVKRDGEEAIEYKKKYPDAEWIGTVGNCVTKNAGLETYFGKKD